MRRFVYEPDFCETGRTCETTTSEMEMVVDQKFLDVTFRRLLYIWYIIVIVAVSCCLDLALHLRVPERAGQVLRQCAGTQRRATSFHDIHRDPRSTL